MKGLLNKEHEYLLFNNYVQITNVTILLVYCTTHSLLIGTSALPGATVPELIINSSKRTILTRVLSML